MKRTINPFRLRLPALALAVGAALAGVAGAQPVDAILKDFVPTGDYLLEIGGQPAPDAKVYQSERVPAILIVADQLASPTLLLPREGSVQTVSIMKLVERQDGTVDLLADTELTPRGAFQLDGDVVSFGLDGKRVRIKPRPDLLGFHDLDEMLAYSPEYRRGAASYQPDAAIVAALRRQPRPVRVKVYFGSWCPHCKHYLPFVLKVAEQLRGSDVDFQFYGLPRGFGDEPAAKKDAVHAVPTAIVYVSGKEAGRIAGDDWNHPERSLRQIVAGS